MGKSYITLLDSTHIGAAQYTISQASGKTFREQAMETIKGPNGEKIMHEAVSPYGFKGVYGFLMDDSAMINQEGFNLYGTALYYNPSVDTMSSIYLSPIKGNAIVGKWIITEDGYDLDYLDDEEVNEVIDLMDESLTRYNELEG